jgi:hypothetical protein
MAIAFSKLLQTQAAPSSAFSQEKATQLDEKPGLDGFVTGHDFTGCGKTPFGGRRGFQPHIKPTESVGL